MIKNKSNYNSLPQRSECKFPGRLYINFSCDQLTAEHLKGANRQSCEKANLSFEKSALYGVNACGVDHRPFFVKFHDNIKNFHSGYTHSDWTCPAKVEARMSSGLDLHCF
uniref:Uncharacterized protein n=1 Tax=Opuntia streptacantha TaxID=393608 RepID=A0A7C8YPX5_OPUST